MNKLEISLHCSQAKGEKNKSKNQCLLGKVIVISVNKNTIKCLVSKIEFSINNELNSTKMILNNAKTMYNA